MTASAIKPLSLAARARTARARLDRCHRHLAEADDGRAEQVASRHLS